VGGGLGEVGVASAGMMGVGSSFGKQKYSSQAWFRGMKSLHEVQPICMMGVIKSMEVDMANSNEGPVYVLITEDGIDQIITGAAHRDKEVKDLKALGCSVKVKTFATWEAAEAFEEKFRGY
jgi:hypothetical protein